MKKFAIGVIGGVFLYWGFLIGVAFTVTGCVLPTEQYVEADRATYEVIAPRYLEYLNQDGRLTQEDIDIHKRLLQSWDLRIRKASGK